MTDDQEKHLAHIVDEIWHRVDGKYRAGAAEHGGNLWDMTALQLVENAIAENLDQLTYLLTARDQLLLAGKG